MYKTEREPEKMATLTLTLNQMYVASYKRLPVFSISEYIYIPINIKFSKQFRSQHLEAFSDLMVMFVLTQFLKFTKYADITNLITILIVKPFLE